MSKWTIYGLDGSVRAVTDTLELHDEWMAECFVTLTISSAEPIDFEVGDYLDYRGDRYTINYDPSVIKKARRGTHGEGFVYDNIKFVSVQDEIVRCDFSDLVLADNKLHYTSLPTFPFFCETVDDLLDRIQACLEELYPGRWTLVSPDFIKTKQRGDMVGRTNDFINAYNKYIGEGSQFTYKKKGVALTADNITCWDALKFVNDYFDLNFIVRGFNVIVGTAGVFTPRTFRYGKGNGLYEIERISDSEQRIVTRLRAYGSEQNLPSRYYANLNSRIYGISTTTEDGVTTLDVAFRKDYFINDFSSGETDIKVEIGGTTYESKAYINADNGRIIVNTLSMDLITEGMKVYIVAGVKADAWPDDHREYNSDNLPDNMSVSRLMLPGFPNQTLHAWAMAHRGLTGYEYIDEMIAAGFEFSTDKYRPYIDSPNKSAYGIRPASIYFDGSDETDDIYPTIEGMTNGGVRVDVISSADTITDNGVFGEGNIPNFNIILPDLGFDLGDVYIDGAAIEMKDGMCGGRKFDMASKPTQNESGKWVCRVKRSHDTSLDLYFPYNDFQIRGGDHYVLTGINMPDAYIDKAAERLLKAAYDALLKNHAPRFTFQPRIDEIWMARQHDISVESGGATPSLHDTLKAGDYFAFTDEDLGIEARIIIDILTIKENGNNGIPTYDVTLRNEKVVSTIQKTISKAVSSSSGNGGGGGGYSNTQIGSLVELEGSELFLSKIQDDEAAGVIGFLKGVWFGARQWMIDALGNANLKNVTVNGILRAINAYINNVQSANYSGDGIADTGWRITNEYDGGNSKATFDYLYIRKKAIFEELELRKLTHIGGNFCLSPASGRAWQVDVYDGDGNLLGYDYYNMPWTVGGILMGLFSRSAAQKFLGKKKRLARKLTDAEKTAMRRVRVYLFSDDGTTKTMTNWTVGAQARCQTFNITEQMEYHGSGVDSDNPDVQYWTGHKVQNTYWWRLVSAVGKAKAHDGKEHDYIEFLVNTGSRTQEDTGSDIPSVGDEFCQFGHRTRTDQQNIIMIETANEDSPAIKMYSGINSWNLNGKRSVILSPKLVEMRASMFKWMTEYGMENITVNRGLWVDIPLDANGKRRCYYNDIVSHNGSYWRCIVAEGTHKEDAAMTHWYTQAELDRMSLEEIAELIDVRNYTTEEPSEDSLDWNRDVYASIAPYLVFSDALIAVPCEKDGKASEAYGKTITVKLMVTNLEATIKSVTLEGADSFVRKSGNNIVVSIPKDAAVTNKDYAVTVEGDLNNQHYIATASISLYAVIRGNDAYEVTSLPGQWMWNQRGADYSYDDIMRMIEEGTSPSDFNIMIDGTERGNSSAQISVINDGVAVPFRITRVTPSISSITATYSNTSGRVWVTYVPNNVETGYIDVDVSYGNGKSRTHRIPFYCNLLGTWREIILGDTRASIAEKTEYYRQENEKAKNEYEQELNTATQELNDLIQAKETARDQTDQIMKDGLITDDEKSVLRSIKKSLQTEYNEAVQAYDPVYNNANLKGTDKTNLANAKSAMDSAYNSVIAKIDQLLAKTKLTKNEADDVNNTFNTFDAKLQAFRRALETASGVISGNAAEAAAATAKSELNDVINANETARDQTDQIMKDGLITDEEKGQLKAIRKTLQSEYEEATGAYSPVYNNANLKGDAKTGLATAKSNMDTAYNAVIAKITELLSMTKITKDGADAVNSTFNTFKAKLQAYRAALETATNSIIAAGDTELNTRYTQFHAEYEQSSRQVSEHFTSIDSDVTNLKKDSAEAKQAIKDAEDALDAEIASTQSRFNDVNSSISDIERDVDTVETNVATYKRSADEDIAALRKSVSTVNGRVDATNVRVSTAEGDISTLKTTTTSQGQSITNLNTRVSTAEGNITTVSKSVKGSPIDFGSADAWEAGGILTTANKTYDEVKTTSTAYIRTTRLFAVSKSSSINFFASAGGYNIRVYYFGNNQKSIGGRSDNSALTKNADTGRYEATIAIPSNVAYVAAAISTTTDPTVPATIGLTMQTADVATQSYVKQTADSVRLGIIDDLGDTGIDISGGKININANNVNFCDSSGTKKNYVQITSDGKIKATDGVFSGYITSESGIIGHLQIDNDKEIRSLGGNLYLSGGTEHSGEALTVYGLAKIGLMSLGIGMPGLVSDAQKNAHKTTKDPDGLVWALENSTSVWVSNSDITLPSWCPVGTMVFVVPIANIKVKLASSSNRILAGTGEIVTESEIGKAHAIYIKTDPINMDGTYRNYWVEWYSA